MKYLLILVVVVFNLMPLNLLAKGDDSGLKFDKRYIQCENKWIALMNKDSTFTYGFVYIDTDAGLTLDVSGTFKVVGNAFVPSPRENSSMKVRIPRNNNLVAIIPDDRLKELGVPNTPDWLKIYQGNTPSARRNYMTGYIYNEWSEFELAVNYLEKAMALDSNIKGLKTELGFTYNALKRYDKAAILLKQVLKTTLPDCYTYKELVYALMNLGSTQEATNTAKKAISDCGDSEIKGEMAYNIAYQYYKLKDKEQFQLWASETAKWMPTDSRWIKALADLKMELDN